MNNILKSTIFSIATCALLLSLQGCGKDRAGISVDEAQALSNNSTGTDSNIPNDSDHDWIPDDQEAKYNTDPNNPDSDGDGISDGCEVGLDPTCVGTPSQTNKPTVADSDGDGLLDGDEVADISPLTDVSPYLTNPLNPDSDGDTLSDGDEVKKYNTNPTTPDTDADGLRDDVEVSNTTTSPTDPDSDKDGLSDGYEVKVSGTQPNVFDSDKDGVSDGIEVCGTFNSTDNGIDFYDKDNNGKVVGVADSIAINEKTSNFYDDTLDVTDPIKYKIWEKVVNGNTVTSQLVSAYDARCQKPADYNNDGVIDAKDVTNDSDGDNRTNIAEKNRGTDPLYSGTNYDDKDLTPGAQNDINSQAYYPWIVQTPDGKKMVDAGFTYVPKADSKGFWMAKYLAVYTDSTESAVKFVKDQDKVDNIDLDTAAALVKGSKDELGINNDIALPSKEQYTDMFAVKSTSNNGCITVKNSVGDENMPVDSKDTICELLPLSANSTNNEFKDNGTVYIKSNGTFTDDSSSTADPSVQFRAATDYIK